MSKAYITEYTEQAFDTLGNQMTVGKGPGVDQTPVTFTTTTQSAAFAATTHLIRVHVDAACHIEFGSNPTATVNSAKMIAGQTEFFHVTPGEKVAFVDAV